MLRVGQRVSDGAAVGVVEIVTPSVAWVLWDGEEQSSMEYHEGLFVVEPAVPRGWDHV
jgi:hypothetical protein